MAKHRRETFAAPQVRARFDNARHTPDAASLFRNVDSLAITTALSPAVRKTVRDRARYVVANCPYAKSMLDTFVTHVVGPWASVSFPRGGIGEELRDEITEAFDAWAMATDFWDKVRTLVRAKVTDGEAFALLVTDKGAVTDANPVTLNVRPIECDRVESYTEAVTRENEFDGIRFDEDGRPTAYRVLRNHPGDYRLLRNLRWRAGDWIKAGGVIHYFDCIRPEQVRGVSDFVSALDIPALQKSYRSSVAETAINAASVSGVLSTDNVPECFDDDEAALGKCAMEVKPNTVFQMQRGAFVTLPEGWHLSQLQSAQPTSLYADFVRALVAEMAACLSMPVNIAMCDSSQHNFASAKLDHMTYGDKIAAVRASLSVKVLDRVFFKWLEEYAVVRGGIGADELAALRRTEWLFTERGNADVMKDASADNTRLGNGTTTRAALYAKDGRDWRRETDQALDEYAYILRRWREDCEANGLPPETPCPILSGGGATKPAPTEDMLEHDAEKKPNKDGKAKAAQPDYSQAALERLYHEMIDGEKAGA